MSDRRIAAIVAVAIAVGAVVAAGLTVDRRPAPARDEAVAVALGPAGLAPQAPGPDALGSTWYCTAGSAATAEGGDASPIDHSVTVANPGDRAVEVRITAVPGASQGQPVTGEPVTEAVEVAPRSRVAVRLVEMVDAPFASAIVEAGRGEVVVEHTIGGGQDVGAAPCSSSTSPTWYVPAGATTRDASEVLVLFNPFPGDAIVDVTFTTPEGVRSPPAFSGFIVPGRRVVAVDVGAVVSRHENVATSVVARSGRLVVERIQRFDGSSGPAGADITPAAPAPAELWYLPDGYVTEGVTEVITVFNPTDDPAEVDVEVTLDANADPAFQAVAEPFALTIGPKQFAQVAVQDDERVPADVGHAFTVRSQNGVPVVAERWTRSSAPASHTGFAAVLGSPVVATRWLSALGSNERDSGESVFLVLFNPTADAIARVRITASAASQEIPIAGLEDVEVAPSGRTPIDLGDYINRQDLILTIESTLPIVVERGLYPGFAGFAQSILVPAAGTTSIPDVDAAPTEDIVLPEDGEGGDGEDGEDGDDGDDGSATTSTTVVVPGSSTTVAVPGSSTTVVPGGSSTTATTAAAGSSTTATTTG